MLATALLINCGFFTATAGQLYVSEHDTSSVLKYITSGAGKTFASIPDCEGLAFDPNGVLYVASYNGGAIYKVGARGSYTVFASGPLIGNPSFLIFDNSGNLFCSYNGSPSGIAKIAPDGSITTFAAPVTAHDLAFDSAGNLYAAVSVKFTQDSVMKFTPDGKYSTFVTDVGDATGLAFDAAGNLFVADPGPLTGSYGIIYKVTPIGAKIVFADGLIAPQGLGFDQSGNLFVADLSGFILKIAPDGTRSTFATGLSQPWDLAFR